MIALIVAVILLVQHGYQQQVVTARIETASWYAARVGLASLDPNQDGEVTVTVGDSDYVVKNHGKQLEVWLNGTLVGIWP
ncbi:hypothetical protein [Lacticaseibacillus suihuaensis]